MPQTQEFASRPGGTDDAHGVQAKALDAAGQAQEKAQRVAGQVQGRLREQIDERSSQLAAQVTGQASDLRQVSESLREQGRDAPARAAEQLAQYAENVGGYLRARDSQALLADAEDLARRQPWTVAAGALALGFTASRFLKASSRRRYHGTSTTVPRPAGVFPSSPAAAGDVPGERPLSTAAALAPEQAM